MIKAQVPTPNLMDALVGILMFPAPDPGGLVSYDDYEHSGLLLRYAKQTSGITQVGDEVELGPSAYRQAEAAISRATNPKNPYETRWISPSWVLDAIVTDGLGGDTWNFFPDGAGTPSGKSKWLIHPVRIELLMEDIPLTLKILEASSKLWA